MGPELARCVHIAYSSQNLNSALPAAAAEQLQDLRAVAPLDLRVLGVSEFGLPASFLMNTAFVINLSVHNKP